MITIVGPGQKRPPDSVLLNTTSRSVDFAGAFSPFRLGPVRLWGGHVSLTIENAWQFSKVYPDQVDESGNPSPAWYAWARRGWRSPHAERYPRGKGAKPLYAWWDGKKLGYIEARKRIYIPLYAEAVLRTPEFEILCRRAENEHIALFDLDGYREDLYGMSLLDVIECPDRTMGHAFVLKLLVEHGGRYDVDQMAAEGLLMRTGRRPETRSNQLNLL